jgi:hypothetical protein
MPSQEEELNKIRKNMAFLESDLEPQMDNDLNQWAKRQISQEERDRLKGMLKENSPINAAMHKFVVGSSLHLGVYRSGVDAARRGPLDEKVSLIQVWQLAIARVGEQRTVLTRTESRRIQGPNPEST